MQPLGILLVEDNSDDVLLVSHALEAVGVTSPLVVVPDGQEAVAYLSGAGQYSDRHRFPLPQLVLLDLELPGMNGFQVLSWVRQNEQLRTLPIVVLTGSVFSSSINTAYLLGANSFVVKPTDFVELKSSLKQTCDFWLRAYSADDGSEAAGGLSAAA